MNILANVGIESFTASHSLSAILCLCAAMLDLISMVAFVLFARSDKEMLNACIFLVQIAVFIIAIVGILRFC